MKASEVYPEDDQSLIPVCTRQPGSHAWKNNSPIIEAQRSPSERLHIHVLAVAFTKTYIQNHYQSLNLL